MSKRGLMFFVVLALLSVMLAGCGATPAPTKTPEPTQAPTPVPEATQAPTPNPEATQEIAAAALRITGNVEKEIGWTEDQVKAMTTKDVQSKNKQGQTQTYTGVPINDLLAQAKPKTGSAGLVLVGGDGSTAEVTLPELQACTNCILSFRSQGGFSAVLPGFSDKVQVKGVIELQVK